MTLCLTRRLSSACVLAALAGTASAQSFNAEFFSTVGSPSAPSSSHGAASGQTGVWNVIRAGSIGSPTTQTMVSLAGAVTGVSFSLGSNSGSSSGSFGAGDFAALMADYANGFGSAGEVELAINGLAPGFYRAWVYAALPPSQDSYLDSFNFEVFHPQFIAASVNNVLRDTSNTAGPCTPGVYQVNKTHGVVGFRVTAAGQTVQLRVAGDTTYFAAQVAFNGVQLRQYTGTRLYVNHAAVGKNTGDSWADAFTSLQEALDTAKDSQGFITEIWIAQGSYKPTTTSNRSISFDIPSGIKLYGGFDGSETLLSQRDPAANLTFLSGDIGTPRVDTDNSYNVVTINNANSSTTLDGLRIVSGYANGSGGERAGGAININNSEPRIRGCAINDNYGFDAGAVKITGTLAPVFTDCEFYRNDSQLGGGAIDYDGPNGLGVPQLKVSGCTFAKNTSSNGGGGMLVNGDARIVNSVFTGNNTILSGAGLRVQAPAGVRCSVDVVNSTFSGNTSTNPGAAIGADGNTVLVGFYNTILWGNDAALGSGVGDGFDSDNSADFDIDRSIIQGAILFPGSTNYNFNPMFVDADGPDNIVGTFDDDLRLQPASAAINAGQNSLLPIDYGDADGDGNVSEVVSVDRDGNARIRPNAANVLAVDLGAYETVVFPACAVDYNADGFLNQEDLGGYLTAFLTEPNPVPGPSGTSIAPCPGAPAPYNNLGYAADYNRDCGLDQEDLGGFITEYFQQAENPNGCIPG